jgi:DNA-directed RNA polymerase subunit RPC12/RpoP
MIDRKLIYNKFDGHCAYCGKKILYKEMQVDHIVPIHRGSSDKEVKAYKEGIDIRGTDENENLNPSCRACNIRKSNMSIEDFRKELEMCHERMMRDNANYRQMFRYGQIKLINNGKITFYFEK